MEEEGGSRCRYSLWKLTIAQALEIPYISCAVVGVSTVGRGTNYVRISRHTICTLHTYLFFF